MKDRKCCSIAVMPMSLLLATLSLTVPGAVFADGPASSGLETAALDTTKAPNADKSATFIDQKLLYGGVSKQRELLDNSNVPLNSSPGALSADHEGEFAQEQSATDTRAINALAIKKLAAGLELSSDEYRSLGAGCLGYESFRTFFQPIAIVTKVYRDSPADKAGICEGDRLLIDNHKDEEARANPQQPLWGVRCGQAGTPADITVLRDGHPVTLTLIRMNIEDIKEPSIRFEREQLIRKLGYPKEGTFIGTSLNSLDSNPSPRN
jgi:hypothetical protein